MLSTWLPLPWSTALHSPQQLAQIQIADVLKELQNLDLYKSGGLDNLDPLYLKWSVAIATPITSLFNLSLVSSEIPKDWKAATVIRLFKGGDTLDPNCYRPTSILPCLSKVLESQVNKQITDHFEYHRTFSAMQSGFRAGHGCISATLKVLNNIITAIDKRLCSRIHQPGQGFRLCQSQHSYRQTQQPWFLKWLPRLVHQLLLRQSSVCQIGGHVVRTSGSLYGGATGFNSRDDSFLCIPQWCRSCCWWVSDPPLCRQHHSVYFWPFFGHCVNKPPDERQCLSCARM